MNSAELDETSPENVSMSSHFRELVEPTEAFFMAPATLALKLSERMAEKNIARRVPAGMSKLSLFTLQSTCKQQAVQFSLRKKQLPIVNNHVHNNDLLSELLIVIIQRILKTTACKNFDEESSSLRSV